MEAALQGQCGPRTCPLCVRSLTLVHGAVHPLHLDCAASHAPCSMATLSLQTHSKSAGVHGAGRGGLESDRKQLSGPMQCRLVPAVPAEVVTSVVPQEAVRGGLTAGTFLFC